jgi:ribosomal protein L11 methyltransferase
MSSQAEDFFCVRIVVELARDLDAVGDPNEDTALQDSADRVIAECWGAGAAGIEERSRSKDILLIIYAASSQLSEVIAMAKAAGGCVDGEPELVSNLDWSESWKQGLEAVVISERLVVRPSFVEFELGPDQNEIVIDPGQAFGTGGHASTRLILEWLDVLSPDLDESTRVLDVGTGTGVLAMAALALGAGRAVGFDLDARAVVEAGVWSEHNGFSDRLSLFVGGIEVLRPEPFDLVVANLLRSELLPIVPMLNGCIGEQGRVLLSGLLASEQGPVELAMASYGFETQGARYVRDNTDRWVSLLMERA